MSTPDTAERISEKAARLLLHFHNSAVAHAKHSSGALQVLCNENYDALADYIASLEADSRRLDVLEELLSGSRVFTQGRRLIVWSDGNRGSTVHDSFREAADAEILRRSNTGDTNG